MRRLIKRRSEEPSPDSRGGLYFASPPGGIEFIPSGCVLLDCVLGGGWPIGRIANIVGDKSTGKTLLAIEAIANFSRTYPRGKVRYAESEAAFDPDYAKALGISLPDSCLNEVQTVEEMHADLLAFCESCSKARAPGLYILDSLDALSDAEEMERDMTKGSYGAKKPRLLSELFRRVKRLLQESKVCFIVISQVRDAIGVTFGDKLSRSGGRALDFYASQALWLAHLGVRKRTINKTERAIGITIRARCKKNKISLPFRECELTISFGYGIEEEESLSAWLKEVGASAAGLSLEDLRQRTREKWSQIETDFIPKRSKYSSEEGKD